MAKMTTEKSPPGHPVLVRMWRHGSHSLTGSKQRLPVSCRGMELTPSRPHLEMYLEKLGPRGPGDTTIQAAKDWDLCRRPPREDGKSATRAQTPAHHAPQKRTNLSPQRSDMSYPQTQDCTHQAEWKTGVQTSTCA